MSGSKNIVDFLGCAATMPGVESADLYSNTAAHVCKRSFKSLLNEVSLLSVEKDQVVLDIGCGTGEVTASLVEKLRNVKELHAVDRSLEFIDYAQTYHTDPVFNFSCLNVESEWPAMWHDKFTLVFSNYVLHWIKDHHKLLRNINKSMRVNGDLVVQFFHSPLKQEDEMQAAKKAAQACGIEQEIQMAVMSIKKQTSVWKDPQSYSKLMTSLGFAVNRCAVVERHVQCSSKFERAGMAVTVNPLMNHVPKEKRSLFAASYVSNLTDPYKIHHNAIIVHATKIAELV